MKILRNIVFLFMFILMKVPVTQAQSEAQKPIRLGISGMTHGHISFILGRKDKGDFKLVGVYEPDVELAQSLSKKYNFDPKLIYSDLDKMLESTKPEAVVAFGSIFEHMATVEACAPKGIHVMVEKPLATNVEHANRMVALAEKYHIHLLTDYETSWYPTTAKSFQLVNDSNYVGKIRKVDDDATILLNYPSAEAVIQASWNWPFGRKDMEIYGETGSVVAADRNLMRLRKETMQAEETKKITSRDVAVYEDPFSYFADVIHGKLVMTKYDPYSLSNNLTVVNILEAARESAKTGKTVILKK